MIRILQVVHEMNQGGIENFLMNVYRTIDKNEIQFDFITHINEKCVFDDEIESMGGTIYHCPDYRIVNHFQYVKWWKNFFQSHPQYKIIHSHLDSCANIHLRVAKKFGLTTIAHAHSSSEGHGVKAKIKSVLKIGFNNCCDYKFACSNVAAKWLYGNEKAEIVKNGIDSRNYIFSHEKNVSMRQAIGTGNYDVVIGHVGQINSNKNQIFIVKMISELVCENINAVAVFVGKETERQAVEQEAIKLGVQNNIKFLGIRNDVAEIMQAFDVFVFPSIYEGLPVTLVEAQASGLPCLVSDTVTREVSITDLVHFKSLNESAKSWAEDIMNLAKENRKDQTENIVNSRYDISATSKWLTDFYSSHVK